VDAIVCIDACFTQKCRSGQQDDPINPTLSVFLRQEDVDAMEHEVEALRRVHSVRSTGNSRSMIETEDLCEQGMRVPVSVLDSCNESFTAADEKRQKIS
ncbi:hypothetical protein SCLCIDRAFT_37742, partial [Scleroderma citrinum Foug A]